MNKKKTKESASKDVPKRTGDAITEQLNRAYAEHPITEDERLVMRKMRALVTLQDRW